VEHKKRLESLHTIHIPQYYEILCSVEKHRNTKYNSSQFWEEVDKRIASAKLTRIDKHHYNELKKDFNNAVKNWEEGRTKFLKQKEQAELNLQNFKKSKQTEIDQYMQQLKGTEYKQVCNKVDALKCDVQKQQEKQEEEDKRQHEIREQERHRIEEEEDKKRQAKAELEKKKQEFYREQQEHMKVEREEQQKRFEIEQAEREREEHKRVERESEEQQAQSYSKDERLKEHLYEQIYVTYDNCTDDPFPTPEVDSLTSLRKTLEESSNFPQRFQFLSATNDPLSRKQEQSMSLKVCLQHIDDKRYIKLKILK